MLVGSVHDPAPFDKCGGAPPWALTKGRSMVPNSQQWLLQPYINGQIRVRWLSRCMGPMVSDSPCHYNGKCTSAWTGTLHGIYMVYGSASPRAGATLSERILCALDKWQPWHCRPLRRDCANVAASIRARMVPIMPGL